jgi:ABC-2 type transport system ATP-binding protein
MDMPTPAIEVTDLHKSYGTKRAVGGVTFTIEQGEIFGILGPNGAGKTTTVECVEGLRVPDTGSVRVFGHDPHADRSAVTAVLGAHCRRADCRTRSPSPRRCSCSPPSTRLRRTGATCSTGWA